MRRRARRHPAAPIYLFPDQAMFDDDEVDAMARGMITGGPLRLPHDRVLFEVTDRGPRFDASIAYATAQGEHVDAFLLVREGKRWSDVNCRARFLTDCEAGIEHHPSRGEREQPDTYATVLTAIVWRALALLSRRATVRQEAVPPIRRPKLAKRGVTGWLYRIVDIDPARVSAAVLVQGGTHASPRWHIRRGHYRSLVDGGRPSCAPAKSAILRGRDRQRLPSGRRAAKRTESAPYHITDDRGRAANSPSLSGRRH